MAQAVDSPIVVAEMRGAVKWIRFNRPEVRNALTLESADLVAEALASAQSDGARVVVLGGNGGAFCAGADVKAMAAHAGEQVNVREMLIKHYHRAVNGMVNLPMPVIAAVDGAAAGIGCDIALAADLRLVSARAFFAQNFVNIALMPDGGGTFSLPKLVGSCRAMEMAMTGLRVGAEQALAWGMVNYVYPVETFESQVQAFAESLAGKAPMALARIKRAIRRSLDGATLDESLGLEAELQQELVESEDFPEGVMAFLSKRPPEFKGR